MELAYRKNVDRKAAAVAIMILMEVDGLKKKQSNEFNRLIGCMKNLDMYPL